MRSAAFFAIFLFGAITICDGKRPHCTLRLHTEANARDGAPFAATIQSQFSGKPVVIEKMPMISEREVVGFRAYPAPDGSYGVLVQLDDHGRLALDTLSVERRGTFLFVFINGRPITELQIDRRVSDGKVYIASGLTANDIEMMKKDWRLLGARKK
ncbi:MAG: hypothetical protein ABJB09_04545 [Verrucomicrobiota bacterium]